VQYPAPGDPDLGRRVQQMLAYDWAIRFESQAKQMMLAEEYKPLISYERLGAEAMLSIPTPDH